MALQVAPATSSTARDESGWMDLLQFVTPSFAAAGSSHKPELDPAPVVALLDAYQVRVCVFQTIAHK